MWNDWRSMQAPISHVTVEYVYEYEYKIVHTWLNQTSILK